LASGDWILYLKEQETIDDESAFRLLSLINSDFSGIAVKTAETSNEYRLLRKNADFEKLLNVTDISISKIKNQAAEKAVANSDYNTISLCMIVRNEEKLILRAAESVQE